MKAVILAAGMGKRLKPLTDDKPKAFLPINEKEIIYYSLEKLESDDIYEVIIVTGFMDSYLKKKLGNRYGSIDIEYVTNKEYGSTGSMYSLSKTEGIVDDDILLLESDLIYEGRAIDMLIDHPYPDVILASSVRGTGDEVYIHANDDGFITDLGKNIEDTGAIGELVGITKLSLPFLNKLYRKAEDDYRKGKKNYHYEEVIFKLSKEHPVKCLYAEDLIWTEIDTYSDLEYARNEIYPRIKSKEN